jgi:hypothetical protein
MSKRNYKLIKKKKYNPPKIEVIILDHEISMVMMSSPYPGDPSLAPIDPLIKIYFFH